MAIVVFVVGMPKHNLINTIEKYCLQLYPASMLSIIVSFCTDVFTIAESIGRQSVLNNVNLGL